MERNVMCSDNTNMDLDCQSKKSNILNVSIISLIFIVTVDIFELRKGKKIVQWLNWLKDLD